MNVALPASFVHVAVWVPASATLNPLILTPSELMDTRGLPGWDGPLMVMFERGLPPVKMMRRKKLLVPSWRVMISSEFMTIGGPIQRADCKIEITFTLHSIHYIIIHLPPTPHCASCWVLVQYLHEWQEGKHQDHKLQQVMYTTTCARGPFGLSVERKHHNHKVYMRIRTSISTS